MADTPGVTTLCFSFLQDHSRLCRIILYILISISQFFSSPSLITGDSLRPDLAFISPDNTLYLLELTVGFETNIEKIATQSREVQGSFT